MSKDKRNTISDAQWASLQRRAARTQHASILSTKAAQQRKLSAAQKRKAKWS